MTNTQYLRSLLELARKQRIQKWSMRDEGKSAYMERRHPDKDARMYGVRGIEGVPDWENWGLARGSAEYIAAMSPDRLIPALEELLSEDDGAASREAVEKYRAAQHDEGVRAQREAANNITRMVQETGEYD